MIGNQHLLNKNSLISNYKELKVGGQDKLNPRYEFSSSHSYFPNEKPNMINSHMFFSEERFLILK